jgi:hypothetical protein
MRKLTLVALFVLCGVLANAAIVPCPVGPVSYATWTVSYTGAGNGCQLGDKIFTNFSTAGVPVDTYLAFSVLATTNFNVVVGNAGQNGALNASFGINYNVTVDSAVNPDGTPNVGGFNQWAISAVQGNLLNGIAGNAFLDKSSTGGPGCAPPTCAATATLVNGVATPGLYTIPGGATSLNVTDVYTFVSGGVTNFSNTFGQSNFAIPEPSTLALLGGALLALGVLRRRRA